MGNMRIPEIYKSKKSWKSQERPVSRMLEVGWAERVVVNWDWEIDGRWNAKYMMITLQLVAGSEDDFHM